MKALIVFLLLIGSASAQYGSKHPNGHWSYPGVETNPAGITQHLLTDHRHELKQSLNGLTIDQQQTLHDLIHIHRRTHTVHCVPYIPPRNSQLNLKPAKTDPVLHVPKLNVKPTPTISKLDLQLVNI